MGLCESPVMSIIEGTGFHPFVVPMCRDGVLYESPVMSVIEGTGFHPFVVPMCRDGVLYESPVMSIIEGTGFHPFVVPMCRDGSYSTTASSPGMVSISGSCSAAFSGGC